MDGNGPNHPYDSGSSDDNRTNNGGRQSNGNNRGNGNNGHRGNNRGNRNGGGRGIIGNNDPDPDDSGGIGSDV